MQSLSSMLANGQDEVIEVFKLLFIVVLFQQPSKSYPRDKNNMGGVDPLFKTGI